MQEDDVQVKPVRYYDNDFDWAEWAHICESKSFTSTTFTQDNNELNWDIFFTKHEAGAIYKPRRYLIPEFSRYFSKSENLTLLEIGCGYGCTCFPILQENPGYSYIATDFSGEALTIFTNNAQFSKYTIECMQWDATASIPAQLTTRKVDIVLCVFAMSAISPELHGVCVQNMRGLLKRSHHGYVLFRDYGLYDLTMFRHQLKQENQRTFMRQDGTICHYFTVEYLRDLFEAAGFEVAELRYATVINKNRKTGQELHRVFLHGVFKVCDHN